MLTFIQRYKDIGIQHANDVLEARIIRLMNELLFGIIILFCILYVPRLLKTDNPYGFLFFFIAQGSVGLGIYANYVGKSNLTKAFFCWFIPLLGFATQFYLNDPPTFHSVLLISMTLGLVSYQSRQMQFSVLIYVLIFYGLYSYFALDVEIAAANEGSGIHWDTKMNYIIVVNVMLFLVMRYGSVSEEIEKELQQKLNKLKKQNTSLQKNQNQLEEQNQELEKVNQELEKYAYVASHDLKSPIRTVNSFLNLIKLNLKDYEDQDVHEYLDYAMNSSTQMYRLVEDILQFSRISQEKEKYETVDLNDVMFDAIHHLNDNLKTSAQFIFNTLPTVYAHRNQITMLFNELLENAILYNNKEQPTVKITCIHKKDSYAILVEDNGIGISDEHYGLVFSIFKRLHTQVNYQGSGVGLASCKKIIELHHGNIYIESEVGKGSIFTIEIPKN